MKVLISHFEGISLVLTEAEIQYLILLFHITEKQTISFLVCPGKSRCLIKFPQGGRACLRATYKMPKIFIVLSCFVNQTFIFLEQNIFSQITKWH